MTSSLSYRIGVTRVAASHAERWLQYCAFDIKRAYHLIFHKLAAVQSLSSLSIEVGHCLNSQHSNKLDSDGRNELDNAYRLDMTRVIANRFLRNRWAVGNRLAHDSMNAAEIWPISSHHQMQETTIMRHNFTALWPQRKMKRIEIERKGRFTGVASP